MPVCGESDREGGFRAAANTGAVEHAVGTSQQEVQQRHEL